VASADKLASSIVAANARIGSLFDVADILADPAGDPVYATVLRIIDQMVVDSKATGAIADTSAVMALLDQAVLDVGAPAYQNLLPVMEVAANEVKTANPGLIASMVDTIMIRVENPPAEPNFTDIIAPSAPTGLSAVTSAITATTSSVALSWSPSTDNVAVAGYDVFRGANKIATVTGPAYTDPSVTSNLGYSYTVVAFDAAGNRSIASTPLSVTPNQASLNVTVSGQLSTDILGLPQNDIFPPSAPTNLTASTSAVTATVSSVTLSWSAATDNVAVTGYDVFRDGAKIATVTSTGYTDPSVTSSVTYSYTVKAFDAAGNRSAASAPLSVTPIQASLGVTVSGQFNP
jgi:chitodextrinase